MSPSRIQRPVRGRRGRLRRHWRRLSGEQKLACAGSLLLMLSTLGPFSWVEAAVVLVALAVLALVESRARGRRFHLPFGDGAVIAAAGVWCGVLVVVRVFERPLGQNALALACAVLLVFAGVHSRTHRPPDDLPTEPLAGGPAERDVPASGPPG